ncbi:hypothetical protein [Halobacillus halophilus]|uniref:hypothetical protein n=1 Tax=Halobacillus halophilus TaxID=1570 RepID=UPI001CD4B55C|nr:hypothetical protein [Halobacillus halophilus]MCA1010569.1 hypothetical protein [Halobacillus halophilus]
MNLFFVSSVQLVLYYQHSGEPSLFKAIQVTHLQPIFNRHDSGTANFFLSHVNDIHIGNIRFAIVSMLG